MKNYIIGVLLTAILVLSGLLYKSETAPRKMFPVVKESTAGDVDVPLLLYVFFRKNNCRDCLEIIETLNGLPPHFSVFGVVPENQLKDEKELRALTGAAFPLISTSMYKKHIPFYSPAIVGVSPVKGNIIFTLPGVPGGKVYLEDFLESLYRKLYPIFLQEKHSAN